MLKSKNSSNFDKNSKILIVITAILVLLYVLSFTRSCSSTDRREIVKTALVNQKYKESITSIILQDAAGAIELSNNSGFWIIQNLIQEADNSTTQISLPASSERINNFLEELIKVRNLYKISDKINKNSSLGLTNGTEFHIRYNFANGEYRELIFGNQDFSLSSRYIMTGENTQVYEIDSSLDTYLTTSIQNWSEPYIISRTASSTDIQQVTAFIKKSDGKVKSGKISDISKLSELRHGGLPSAEEILESEKTSCATLVIENGDKSSINIEIFESENQESTYIVKASYLRADKNYYISYSKISSWTYNKIKEITL